MAEEKYTFKLLVEGNDDKHVVIALWNNAKLPETFDVVDCHSITKLLDNLKIRLTLPQTNERIGVIVDALMAKADEVLNELETKKIQKYKNVHRAKAKIHSYLAWQDEPGKPMGVSITAHVLNPDSPSGIKFLEWLKRLFS